MFDPKSPYEIFVRDLIAKDGNDQLVNEFKVLFKKYLSEGVLFWEMEVVWLS